MSTAIFIKSYAKDFRWLNYCLKSICKYVTGYSEVVLMLDEGSNTELHHLTELPNKIRIEWISKEGDGYIFQQYCKLVAHHYTKADKIMFVDSDFIFDKYLDLSTLPEKTEILMTDYSKVGDAICWKECTEQFLKAQVEFEFMRRLPLVFNRTTLEAIESFQPNLKEIVLSSIRFSEFNVMGAFAYIYERDNYSFVNTDDWVFIEPLGVQLWSWADCNSDNPLHLVECEKARKCIKELFNEEI